MYSVGTRCGLNKIMAAFKVSRTDIPMSTVQCSTVQCSAVQSSLQCSAVQYSEPQYSTVQGGAKIFMWAEPQCLGRREEVTIGYYRVL